MKTCENKLIAALRSTLSFVFLLINRVGKSEGERRERRKRDGT
jgi:hypothetical protein